MTEHWQVIAATPYDRADPEHATRQSTVMSGNEAEARRVYADTISSADEHGYSAVTLTRGGVEVESWPQATGWTV